MTTIDESELEFAPMERTYSSLDSVIARFQDPNRTESLAELVSELCEEDQRSLLGDSFNSEAILYDWNFWGRPKQFIRNKPYFNIHLFLTGRGFGKTRSGAEWVREKAKVPGTRIALLGRTAAEVRDVSVLGESGILNIPQPESEKPVYKPSEAAIYWPNGSYAKLYSAEKPDAVRGAQFDYAWCDELASYTPYVGADGLTAFDNLLIATRLGDEPIVIVTTTPKRVASVRKLLSEAEEGGRVKVIRGSTSENKSNMGVQYMENIYGSFEGTAIARQELDGEMLDETPEGALWDDDMISHVFLTTNEMMKLPLRIVSVDPTVAAEPTDECGIVVIGSTAERALHKRTGYVLEDASLKASPEVWAQKVVEMAHKWKVHGIIVEKNQGHHLLSMAITNIDPDLEKILYPVNAGTSKALRAEPVSQIYEQSRVKHVAPGYPLLESQMTTWEPNITKKSPDRVDALVHGITALMLKPPEGLVRKRLVANSRRAADSKLPTGIGTGRARGLTRRR